MFQLSLVDHIRLSFSHAQHTYLAHAEAAERLAHHARRIRIGMLAVLGLATCAGVIALSYGRFFQIAAAVLIGGAYALYGVAVLLDFEPRISAHRATAARLWLVSDKYRALLGDLQDGVVDAAAATAQRDALMHDVQSVYEVAPAGDRNTLAQIRRSVAGTDRAYTDEEIDRFLPASLRRGASESLIPHPSSSNP